MAETREDRRMDAGLLVLRLALGTIVLFHGVFKLTHGVGWISDMLRSHGLPGFIAYGAYVAEVVAPLLLFLGVLTRLAALTIVVDMLVAVLMVQHRQIFTVNQGGGWGIEIEALILFTSLALAIAGGGRYAVTRSGPLS
jgi:putative oxidoreductase